MARDLLSIELKAPAGVKLRFLSMDGHEELSRLFEYSLVAVAKPTDTIDFNKLLGSPVQVTVKAKARQARIYHGLVTAARFEEPLSAHLAYRLTVKPWLWLATRSAQVRIFSKMSTVDVLKKVLAPYGGQVDVQLHGTYPKREYRVQYRESDFDFVSRLMEEEGIFYFFKHEDGKHTLVLADDPSVHQPMLGLSKLVFGKDGPDVEHVRTWRWSQALQTGKVSVRDFTFLAPGQTFEKSATVANSHAHADTEIYDYPAGVSAALEAESSVSSGVTEAEAVARRRVQEQQSRFSLADGETGSTLVCTGASLTLEGHGVSEQNRAYIVLSTRVQMRWSGYEAGATDESTYAATCTVFPGKPGTFRPARSTPKPRVAGPQTATVVGPAGEEIFVDKYGRVKVQFHWDREGKKDANSSCFIRVAQPSAGKGFGMVFLPRIGQEVVVDFLEGDPDQPLITGRVYNADQMPPYALPKEKTVSTIRSRSSGNGAAVADHNELRFDDLKDKEYLLLHAQKNQLAFVKETAKSLVGKEEHHTVEKDAKHKIGGEYHLTVAKDVKQKFDGKLHTTAAKGMLLKSGGVHSLKAAKDITAESGAAISMKSAKDLHLKIGANIGAEAAQNVHIKGGMNIVIEGGMQVTIKGGSGSIVLGPDGVSITGPMVKINSGGSPGSGSGAKPVAPTDPEMPTDPEKPVDPLA